MANFRIISKKLELSPFDPTNGISIFIPRKDTEFWRGENFPTNDELSDSVLFYDATCPEPPSSCTESDNSFRVNLGLRVQERHAVRLVGRTVTLPLWKDVNPEIIRALVLLNEPELEGGTV